MTREDKETLREWVRARDRKDKMIQQAHVLPGSDKIKGRQTEGGLAESYHLSIQSGERIRKDFFEKSMNFYENQERKVGSDKKTDGRVEAHLVTFVWPRPPEGKADGKCNC